MLLGGEGVCGGVGLGAGLGAAGGGGGNPLLGAWQESRTQACRGNAGGWVEKANRLLFPPMELLSIASLGCHLERDITLRAP